MHITDLLSGELDDFAGERNRLVSLFSRKTHPDLYGCSSSLKSCVEWKFDRCKIRGTSISVDDLLQRTEVHWKNDTLDGLLLFCEIIINLLACVNRLGLDDDQLEKWYDELLTNAKNIADKTGHKFILDKDGIAIAVKEDALASAVIEDIDDKPAARAILEYNRVDNKRNLKEKRELLVRIARYLEPTLKDKDLKEPRKSLSDDINFALNNFNIRHNNDAGKSANVLLPELTSQMLEIVYDDLYRAMLLFFEFEKYAPGSERFVKLRKLLKERTEEVKKKGV